MTRTGGGRVDERRKRRAAMALVAADALKRGEVALLRDFDDREGGDGPGHRGRV
jgi:hypothetical protein